MAIEKDFVVTTYVEIDETSITTSGVRTSEFSPSEAIDRVRNENHDFTLINIKVGAKRFLLVASDVCVCEDATRWEPKDLPAKYVNNTDKENIKKLNEGLPSREAIVGLPGSCIPVLINNMWR